MYRVIQLLLVKKLKFSILVIINANYWLSKLYISINNRDRLKTRLMIKDILRDIQLILAIKNILSILINKALIDSIVQIMSKDESKVKMVFFLNDSTFLFTYNMKTTISSQFPNPRLFYINNFQADISMAIEIQIYFQNFKPKNLDKYTCEYLFKLVNIQKIQNV